MSASAENFLKNGDLIHLGDRRKKPYRTWLQPGHIIFAAKHLGESEATTGYKEGGFADRIPRAMGLFAYKEINGKWGSLPLGFRIPTVTTLNTHKAMHFEPLGAHNAKFEIARSRKPKSDEFSSRQIVEALADSTLLIGNTPRFFHHDVHDHSLQAATVSAASMDRLKALSQATSVLWQRDMVLARSVSNAIAEGLDRITDFNQYYDAMDTNLGIDFVVSAVMHATSHANNVQRFIAGTLEKKGVDLLASGEVIDHPTNAEYYQSLRTG